MSETHLTGLECTPSGPLLHYTRTGEPAAAYRVPSGAGWAVAGRLSAPTRTLFVYGDEAHPTRPTFAALLTPDVWRALAPLLP